MNTAIVILNYNTYQMTLDYVENLIENFGNQVKLLLWIMHPQMNQQRF